MVSFRFHIYELTLRNVTYSDPRFDRRWQVFHKSARAKEKQLMYRRAILAAVVVALALIMAPTALADTSQLTVVRPSQSEKQTDKTYGEWSALWWQTMLK